MFNRFDQQPSDREGAVLNQTKLNRTTNVIRLSLIRTYLYCYNSCSLILYIEIIYYLTSITHDIILM